MLTHSDLRDLGLSRVQLNLVFNVSENLTWHMFCWTAQSHMELSYFRLFWTDIFANLSLELVYSQLE